jgi:hypothetical protein
MIAPERPVEEATAKLERALIDEFLRQRGHDPDVLRGRSDPTARTLLKEAALYASVKLTEVESRAHYLDDLRSCEA